MAGRPRGAPRATSPQPRPATEIDFVAIVESATDIIYTLDLDGRITYFNARAYEIFGYEPGAFLGQAIVDVLAPGASGAAVDAIRHRTEFPRDRQVFRVEALHRDGTPIPLEVHGGPLLRDGRMIGRMGICRVLASAQRDDGTAAQAGGAHGLQGERMRIARGLRDAIAQVVFGVTADGDATESFLSDVKRATVDEVARRLRSTRSTSRSCAASPPATRTARSQSRSTSARRRSRTASAA